MLVLDWILYSRLMNFSSITTPCPSTLPCVQCVHCRFRCESCSSFNIVIRDSRPRHEGCAALARGCRCTILHGAPHAIDLNRILCCVVCVSMVSHFVAIYTTVTQPSSSTMSINIALITWSRSSTR